jgi:hypothetical protein
VEKRSAASGVSRVTQTKAVKVARADPELAKKVGLGEVSLPDAVAQVTGKPKRIAKPAPIPKVGEPSDDEGVDQEDLVEALLAENAQLKEENATLHRAAGVDEILVFIRNGTRRDAVMYSAGANSHHGLRRTNEDKRKAAQTLLADPEWAAWSDREIARQCNVVHAFVAKVRAGMPHLDTNPDSPAHLETFPDSQPASTRTVSRGGKEYQQDTSGVAESNKKRANPKAEEPKPEEPAEEEGIEQDNLVEAVLAENAQLKEESDTPNQAAGPVLPPGTVANIG